MYGIPDVTWDPISISPIHGSQQLLRMAFSGTTATAGWPVANLCLYTPIYINGPITAYTLWLCNGTVSGSVCMGLYNEDGTQRLINTGPITQAGANIMQELAFSPAVQLTRGRYWLGLVCSSTSTQVRTWAASVSGGDGAKWMPIVEETLGSTQVPTTMTPVASARAIVPYVGLTTISQAF
jgi:hypothetical protein